VENITRGCPKVYTDEPPAALACVFPLFLQAQQLDGMSTGELLSMLSFGADRILANDAGEAPSDADLDKILERWDL
jgi:hypothetical protein